MMVALGGLGSVVACGSDDGGSADEGGGYYGGTGGEGLRLTDVSADSPAAQGGLKAGDIITKFGEVEVVDIQGLADGLRKYKAGTTTTV